MTDDAIFKGAKSMLPGEMIILMAIVVSSKVGQNVLTRPLDITREYVGYLFNSLVNRGYLKQHSFSGGYQLTPTGREEIFNFIKKNRARSRDIFERLRLLGIEISRDQEQRIHKLEREAIKAT
jgi:DNA-binding MarR family transcriptional regulator